jgi:hypothetical protein
LNGLPGIILAVGVAIGAFQAYVHKREELAVARAAWKQTRDSLRNTIIADALAADARDKQRNDSIAKLNARITVATRTAAAAGQAFETTIAAIRATVDSNTAVALDSLEAQHGRQVLSLQEALAVSRAETQVANDKIADRDAQLLKLRGDLAISITRADTFERQAHPGWLKKVIDSPVTHLVAFGTGVYVGSR